MGALKPAKPEHATGAQFRKIAGSDLWAVSKKLDGFRALWDGTLYITRNGTPLTKPHPAELVEFGRALPPGVMIDGELIGGKRLHVFDVVAPEPLSERLPLLDKIGELAAAVEAPVEIVEHVSGDAMFDAMKAWLDAGAEGFVFRQLAAAYPRGGGENRTRKWLKWKLVNTVDVFVSDKGVGGRRNLELSVYRDGVRVAIGKSSALTGDGPRCQIGDVVEVKVLDFTGGDRLLQCVKPILRVDKSPEECTWDQLELVRKDEMR